jgi:putative FmdB family regulatory protein
VPLYEYQCPTCGRFELIHKFSDPPLLTCPTCGCEVQKLLSAPAIQFKGTGWYLTDYARKGQSKGDGGKSDGGRSEGSKDAGGASGDAKPAAASSTATKDRGGSKTS